MSFLGCNLDRGDGNVVDMLTDAEKIIASAIAYHGGDRLNTHDIEFRFRDKTYTSKRNKGIFSYERIFRDSTGRNVRDVLNNDGLTRYIDGKVSDISEEKKAAYSNSVNSVIYFALLPYFLRDPAVNSELLGEVEIRGKNYNKIKVTFREEGGGRDHEDEYIYWFDKKTQALDYLAYNYLVEGGGARFREAYNIRNVGGIRFSDYINYKPTDTTRRDVKNFDHLFVNGELEKLSLIETKEVVVR